jgi:hypothetical protein
MSLNVYMTGSATSVFVVAPNNGTPVSVFDGYQSSYQHQDLLGTKRLLTGSDGSVIGASTSLPFGDGLSLAGADTDPYHFAGLVGCNTSPADTW